MERDLALTRPQFQLAIDHLVALAGNGIPALSPRSAQAGLAVHRSDLPGSARVYTSCGRNLALKISWARACCRSMAEIRPRQ
jgi:hypothetical protein